MVERHLYDWVGKIIIKSRPGDRFFFKSAGYQEEAFVKGYFAGTDMHFLTRYLKPERMIRECISMESGLTRTANSSVIPLMDITVVQATENDAEELAGFYGEIFTVYPTPIADPSYLKRMISGDSVYMLIRHKQIIVSAACAEVNRHYKNAELSDCATLPEYGGKGLMKIILNQIIEKVEQQDIDSVYSIARARSSSMNSVFQSLGFEFTGTLIRNVKISSGLEDMNVWSRLL